MSYMQTATRTASYTTTDIQNVVRQLTTDFRMMARSSGAITEEVAVATGQDIEVLAIEGLLKSIDVTLLDAMGGELRAVRYEVDEDTGQITSSRPGGVLWPETPGGDIRVVVTKTREFTDAVRRRLTRPWGPSHADTSHSGLAATGSRDYASNTYGLRRRDWS